jgi:predicted heme/steroid binding protein
VSDTSDTCIVNDSMKIFSKEELNKFNGKNGNKSYISYKGLVYDVSSSYHWRNGEHWVVHNAGMDLTAEMEDAPHLDDMLDKFEVVGKLEE